MSAALARRDEGCASDLLMDRWLLGEIPGSDEARRLEQHVRTCAPCEARLLALRSLYGNRPAAAVTTRAERPRPVVPAPAEAPAPSGVLQIVMLRDGLLVGTEVFTPGRYSVGSDRSCGLKLEDVEPSHAWILLRGGRVVIEAQQGEVFVNGYRATRCEVRPVDEIVIGRYVLRTRVLPREGKAAEPPTQPMPRPLPDATALKLELYWGQARQAAGVFETPPTPAQLEPYGLASASAVEGGFELVCPDGERVRVSHGDRARLALGPLTVVATAVPAQPQVARRPVREWPWMVISLATTLFVAVVVFGALAPVPDEAPFTPKLGPSIVAFIPVPPRQVKPPPPVSHPPRVRTPPRHWPDGRRFVPPSIIDGVKTPPVKLTLGVLDALDKLKPPRGKRVAGLGALALMGVPGAQPTALHFDDEVGIGAGGFRNAGTMRTGNIGQGSVQGRVSNVDARRVRTSDTGEIDRDAVAKVIQSHLSEISRCYERAMIAGGSFAGKMTLEWAIDASGTVSHSRVKQTDVKSPDFGACVLTALGTWRFPPAHGHVVISYPFHLNAVGY